MTDYSLDNIVYGNASPTSYCPDDDTMIHADMDIHPL